MATKGRHLKTPIQLWIVDNRKRLGLEPRDLATLVGVTEDTARGWESRGKPSEDALTILERRFGQAAPRGDGSAGQDALLVALRDQTAAISSLVEVLGQRQQRVSEAPAAYVTDPAVAKRRRAYWIQQAFAQSKLTRPQLRVAVELPAGRERTLARWLAGELPAGAQLQRFARALMLPLSVLEDPPPTDDERLVQWRQEAIAEVELERPAPAARQRRTA